MKTDYETLLDAFTYAGIKTTEGEHAVGDLSALRPAVKWIDTDGHIYDFDSDGKLVDHGCYS